MIPSGEKATQVTVSVCPWSAASNPSVVADIKGSIVSQANRLNRRTPTAISNWQFKSRFTGILRTSGATLYSTALPSTCSGSPGWAWRGRGTAPERPRPGWAQAHCCVYPSCAVEDGGKLASHLAGPFKATMGRIPPAPPQTWRPSPALSPQSPGTLAHVSHARRIPLLDPDRALPHSCGSVR